MRHYIVGPAITKTEDYYRDDDEIVERVLDGTGLLAVGLRRSGKTSFLHRIRNEAAIHHRPSCFLHLPDYRSPASQDFAIDEVAEQVKEDGGCLVLIDEVEVWKTWSKERIERLLEVIHHRTVVLSCASVFALDIDQFHPELLGFAQDLERHCLGPLTDEEACSLLSQSKRDGKSPLEQQAMNRLMQSHERLPLILQALGEREAYGKDLSISLMHVGDQVLHKTSLTEASRASLINAARGVDLPDPRAIDVELLIALGGLRRIGEQVITASDILAHHIRQACGMSDGSFDNSVSIVEDCLMKSSAAEDLPSSDTISVADIGGSTDIAILTIRTDEFEAVLKRFPLRKMVVGGRRYYDHTKVSTADGGELGVAFVRFPAQGQGMAQAVTRDVIDDLNPSWLFVVGIGGGIPDNEYSLGDVVVATRFEDFSISATIQDKSPEYSLAGGPVHQDVESLLGHLPAQMHRMRGWNTRKSVRMKKPDVIVPIDIEEAVLYGDEEWKRQVQRSLQTNFPDGKRRRPPKIRSAPIITSNSLIKDTSTLEQWRQVARHAEAVEMEVGGVYLAARHGGKRNYRIVAIRGLSDIVGFKRSGDWTAYACHSAAVFCAALIHSGMIRSINGPSASTSGTG